MSSYRVLVPFVIVGLLSSPIDAKEPPKTTGKKAPPAAKEKTPPEGHTPDPKDRATKLAKEGAELARNGRYQDAAAKFQQSLAIYPIVDVYYNLGYCYEQLGNLQGCVDYYKRYLEQYRKTHNNTDPPEVQGVQRSIEKCTEKRQPPITVTSNPTGAQVSLGSKDKLIGTTTLTYKLKPGTYKLFIAKAGYVPVATNIVVLAQQPGKFHFDLRKVQDTGKLSVAVNVKGATIYIDGKNYGISPFTDTPDLKAGRHQIVITKDRYSEINATFTIAQGKTTELKYNLFLIDPPPSWRSYLGWAFVSIGVVSVAGGVVAFQFADAEFNDTSKFDDLIFYQNLAYGIGGGLLGTGTALLIWEAFTDSVDTRDLIRQSALPVNIGIVPTRDRVYIGASVRF